MATDDPAYSSQASPIGGNLNSPPEWLRHSNDHDIRRGVLRLQLRARRTRVRASPIGGNLNSPPEWLRHSNDHDIRRGVLRRHKLE
jgi:hypothetical protein